MSIYSHMTIGCSDLAASQSFYDAVLRTLGINNLGAVPDRMVIYGVDQPELMIVKPIDGNPACHGNGITIGLKAASRDQVRDFHAAGLTNGGTCEGAPGNREQGPPGNYAAYLRDPVGNKLVAVTFSSE